jgi:hypothetical protein
MRLTENTKIVMKQEPGVTGGWTAVSNAVNMANYAKCRIILAIHCNDAAVAGGAVTLAQGISAAACTTSLAFAEYWKCEDCEAGDTLTKVSATSLAAGVRNKVAMYIFEIRADMLDSDTFKSENQYVGLTRTDITTATEACSVTFELYEPRYARGAANMPTAW